MDRLDFMSPERQGGTTVPSLDHARLRRSRRRASLFPQRPNLATRDEGSR
jgi:hypothetical protein